MGHKMIRPNVKIELNDNKFIKKPIVMDSMPKH